MRSWLMRDTSRATDSQRWPGTGEARPSIDGEYERMFCSDGSTTYRLYRPSLLNLRNVPTAVRSSPQLVAPSTRVFVTVPAPLWSRGRQRQTTFRLSMITTSREAAEMSLGTPSTPALTRFFERKARVAF